MKRATLVWPPRLTRYVKSTILGYNVGLTPPRAVPHLWNGKRFKASDPVPPTSLAIEGFIMHRTQKSLKLIQTGTICHIGHRILLFTDTETQTYPRGSDGPVGWSCKIHQMHLCRGVRLLQRVSWILYLTIWWRGFSNTWVLENSQYLFVANAPRSTLTGDGSTWLGPIYMSNRTKCCNYAKLNCLKKYSFYI